MAPVDNAQVGEPMTFAPKAVEPVTFGPCAAGIFASVHSAVALDHPVDDQVINEEIVDHQMVIQPNA